MRRKETLGVWAERCSGPPASHSRDAAVGWGGESLFPVVLPHERQGRPFVSVFSPRTGCSGRRLGNIAHL